VISLADWEAKLSRAIAETVPAIEIGLDKVGTLIETLAAHYPGHYQPGWAPLADATIKDKEAKGFEVPSPLKRTGEMAESYHKTLLPAELAVVVGSPEKIAAYQELGTAHIPPRPVLSLALHNSHPYALDVFRKIGAALLSAKGMK
jgi:hypothetical protein